MATGLGRVSWAAHPQPSRSVLGAADVAPYTIHQWPAAGGPPVAALQCERARIAKDLHDELGGRLTQITLLSELARQ